MAETLKDKLKRLAGEKPENAKKPSGEPGTGKGRNYVPNGKGRGGWRGGIKPTKEEIIEERGRKEYVEEFYDGGMMIQITDPKTGKVRIVEKNRTLIALEKLFNRAVKGEGDTEALAKFLDRALGRAKQPLTGGDEGDEPIKHEVVGLDGILEKAYGNEDS